MGLVHLESASPQWGTSKLGTVSLGAYSVDRCTLHKSGQTVPCSGLHLVPAALRNNIRNRAKTWIAVLYPCLLPLVPQAGLPSWCSCGWRRRSSARSSSVDISVHARAASGAIDQGRRWSSPGYWVLCAVRRGLSGCGVSLDCHSGACLTFGEGVNARRRRCCCRWQWRRAGSSWILATSLESSTVPGISIEMYTIASRRRPAAWCMCHACAFSAIL